MITDTKLRKIVLWIAKIATLIISAPATIGLVDTAYKDKGVSLFVVLLVKVASLLVVEGAFLYFWQLVEDTKSLQNKEEREQNVYVLSAWSMYVLLLVVGLLHGEGAAALIIRFAMGLLLFVATNDKLAAMQKKYEEERIKGKRKTRKERRKESQAEESISLALIEARKKAQIAAINNKSDLLDQVSQEVIIKRILLGLPAGDEVVEGELVEESNQETEQLQEEMIEQSKQMLEEATQLLEEIKEATAVAEYTREETVPIIQQIEELETKIVVEEVVVFDNGSYKVVKRNGDFVVSCYACSYQDVKLGSASSNAYTSAIRAGSKHMGKHKKEETKEATF